MYQPNESYCHLGWADHYLTPDNLDINLEGTSYQQQNFKFNGWMK